MDSKSATILGVCIILAALLVSGSSLHLAKSGSREQTPSPLQNVTPAPRFQFIHWGKENETGHLIVFDTETGRVWFSPAAGGVPSFANYTPADLRDPSMPKK